MKTSSQPRRGSFGLLALCAALSVLLSTVVVNLGSTPAQAQQPQSSFTVEGGGWGHGLGMSQFGAYGRAAAGHTSTEILQAYYQGVEVESRAVTNNVRVHLSTSSNTTLSFGSTAKIKLDGKLIAEAGKEQNIAVSRLASRWAITVGGVDICVPQPVADGQEPLPNPCIGNQLRFVVKDLVDQHLSTSSHSYRHGRLELTPTSSGATTFYVVLGQLKMDEYLYGLAEMPSSWAAEALKAQAIAGRSYAEGRILARRADSNWNRPFDLFATTQDQAFTGNSKELGAFSENWVGAVDATNKIIATYNGTVIDALYGSSTGGHSENSEYVFTNKVPYLRGAPDEFDSYQNPLASWTRTYSADELTRWLSAGVGTIENVNISGNIGVSGRVNKATVNIKGTEGSTTMTGARFRILVNAGLQSEGRWSRDDQILSTNFKLVGPDDRAPLGELSKVQGRVGKVRVAGWALDQDTNAAIRVQVSIDGKRVKTRQAKRNTAGLDARYGVGNNHGFRINVKATPGTHEVCVTAVGNVKGGPTTGLGCKTVTVKTKTDDDPKPDPSGDIPVGELEIVRVASVSDPAIRVAGWALDPTSNDSINVAFDIDRQEAARSTARFERDDLDSYGRGSAHGFDVTLPTTTGKHQVCVRAISANGEVAVIIGCQDITVG